LAYPICLRWEAIQSNDIANILFLSVLSNSLSFGTYLTSIYLLMIQTALRAPSSEPCVYPWGQVPRHLIQHSSRAVRYEASTFNTVEYFEFVMNICCAACRLLAPLSFNFPFHRYTRLLWLQMYPYCDSWCLSWPYRWAMIRQELEDSQG
jgi:hypothetical protein